MTVPCKHQLLALPSQKLWTSRDQMCLARCTTSGKTRSVCVPTAVEALLRHALPHTWRNAWGWVATAAAQPTAGKNSNTSTKEVCVTGLDSDCILCRCTTPHLSCKLVKILQGNSDRQAIQQCTCTFFMLWRCNHIFSYSYTRSGATFPYISQISDPK